MAPNHLGLWCGCVQLNLEQLRAFTAYGEQLQGIVASRRDHHAVLVLLHDYVRDFISWVRALDLGGATVCNRIVLCSTRFCSVGPMLLMTTTMVVLVAALLPLFTFIILSHRRVALEGAGAAGSACGDRPGELRRAAGLLPTHATAHSTQHAAHSTQHSTPPDHAHTSGCARHTTRQHGPPAAVSVQP